MLNVNKLKLSEWDELESEDKTTILKKIIGGIALPVTLKKDSIFTSPPRLYLKVFDDIEVCFRLIFSHSYFRGLTEENEESALDINPNPPLSVEEMRPVISESVDAFLISEFPISNFVCASVLSTEKFESNLNFPAYLTMEDVDLFLERTGLEAPTEVLWEAAVRGGESFLFPFGNILPSDAELGTWMDFDMSSIAHPSNKYGLRGLFYGEWCSDIFRENLMPTSSATVNSKTIRGGGAYFWPWQDEEWVWCISAMRMPSTDLDDVATATLRPIIIL